MRIGRGSDIDVRRSVLRSSSIQRGQSARDEEETGRADATQRVTLSTAQGDTEARNGHAAMKIPFENSMLSAREKQSRAAAQ